MKAHSDHQYRNLCDELKDIAIDRLNFRDQGIEVQKSLRHPVSDEGLSEDVAALFYVFCREAGHEEDLFRVAPITDESKSGFLGGSYSFQYSWEAVEAVERAIRTAEELRSIAMAVEREYLIRSERARRRQEIDTEKLGEQTRARAKKNIRTRTAMWREIEEGLSRILKPGASGPAPSEPAAVMMREVVCPERTWKLLGLHIALRRLNREGAVLQFPAQPDVVLMAHYHLQMVIRRFGIPIVFTGHYVMAPFARRPGIVSHLGSPSLFLSDELRVIILRGPFTSPDFRPREVGRRSDD